MTSCNCKYLAHIGKDFNGNRIIYNPLNHSIKDCTNNRCQKTVPTKPGFSDGTCIRWIPGNVYPQPSNLDMISCIYWKDNCGNQCIDTPESTKFMPICTSSNISCSPTPIPSICASLNTSQCTAWQKFFHALPKQSKTSFGNACIYTDISEHPCICSDLITCSGGYITELKFNDIPDISFNLSSIVDFSNLELIETTSTNINGSLSDLSSMHKLSNLNFYMATGISGNLRDLSKMSGLTVLDFNNAVGIYGNLSSLSEMSGLTYINFSSATGISGNLRDLSSMHKLSILSFGMTT